MSSETIGAAVEAAVAGAGERLRGVRAQRRTTLTAVAASTGISKSTLIPVDKIDPQPTRPLA